MSDVQIPNLPAASSLSGQEQIEVVQNGVSARATTQQLADLGLQEDEGLFVLKTGDAMTGPLAINSGNSTVGLTINAPDDVYAPRNLLINSKAGAEIDLDSGVSGAVYGFLSNGLYQWDISMNGPGGSLVIDRYNYVTGAWIDQPFQIEQGSGRVIIANDMVVVGDTTLNTLSANGACTFTGNVSFTNTVSIINGSINGGSINGTPIGATTPSTGKFTTLSASGVVSGAGFTALLAPYALINSQVFTGTPSLPTGTTGVTQSPGDSSTKLATTAFVGAATTALGLGTMAAQNANAVAITGGAINNTAIGATTRSSGAFTTLAANGAATFTSSLTASPASANVVLSPTGTGTVTINPATLGHIDNTAVGATTPSTGAFTTLSATGTVSGAGFTTLLTPYALINSQVFTGTPSLPTGTIGVTQATADNSTAIATTAFVKAQGYQTIAALGTMAVQNANAVAITGGNINGTIIGNTTAVAATFSSVNATGALTASPPNANVTLSPTGTGTVTINPATLGNINNMTIGATTAAAGTFTNLTATGTVGGAGFTTLLTPYALVNSQVFTGTPSLPTGTIGVTQATADSTTKLATTAFVKAQAYLTANQTITHTGDVTGSGTTSIPNLVVQLQGRPLSAALPASGNLMGWNGSTWLPVAAGAAAAGGTANQIQYNNGGVLGGIATTGTFAGSNVVMSIAPTLTNSLNITGAASNDSTLVMNKSASLQQCRINAQTAGVSRWQMMLGDTTAEGGSNAGSDFTLSRFTDAGGALDSPLKIIRSTGVATFAQALFSANHTINGGSGNNATNTINKAASGFYAGVFGQTAGVNRWGLQLGDGTAESANAGSDFRINRYNDAGTGIDAPLVITRLTGQATYLSPAKFPSNATNANTNPTGLDGVIIDGAAGNGLAITGSRAGSMRWRTSLGSNAAESGSNAGSDFAISNYSDAGALLGTPMTIGRASGYTYFNGNGATAVTSDTGPYGHGAVRVNKAGSGKTAQIAGFNNGLTRWVIDMGNAVAETGSNVGSDFAISRCADAGGGIDSPLSITRSSGQVFCPAGVFVGSTNIGTTFIELGTPGASTASYIDFHSGATNNDYDCRILSSGGTVAAGGGSLGITAASTAVSGSLTVNGNLIGGTIYATSGQITLYQQSAAGFINLCDSAGNNGGSYSMAVRGLGSAFSAQVNLSGFAIYANATSCNGTLTVLNSINTTAANARVDAIGGFSCRLGANGTPSGNVFSYYWNTDSHLYGSVDTTNLGWIAWSSDYRIKRDIAPLPSMWDRVKALKPVSYFHKEWTPEWVQPKENGDAPDPLFRDDGVENWGFVAHELQETLTQSAATGVKDEVGLVQSPNPWVVIATLTKALQEAMARIEALEARA